MKRNFKLMGLSRMRSIIPSSRGEFHFFMTNRYQRFTDGTGISAGSSTPTTANGSNISVVANGLFPFPMSMHSIQVGAVAPTTTISAGHAGGAFKCGLPVFELSELPSYIQTNIRYSFQQCLPSRFTSIKAANIIPRRLGGGRDGIADGTNPDPDFGGERRRGEGERRDDEGEGEGGGGEDPPVVEAVEVALNLVIPSLSLRCLLNFLDNLRAMNCTRIIVDSKDGVKRITTP